MKKFFTAALAAFFVLFALAVFAPPEASAQGCGNASVFGRVTTSNGFFGVPNIRVAGFLEGNSSLQAEAFTNSSGYFALTTPTGPCGNWHLAVDTQHPYDQTGYSVFGANASITTTSTSLAFSNVDFSLNSCAATNDTAMGVVKESNNTPMSGVTVVVKHPRTDALQNWTSTDSNGTFGFFSSNPLNPCTFYKLEAWGNPQVYAYGDPAFRWINPSGEHGGATFGFYYYPVSSDNSNLNFTFFRY